MYRQLIAEAGYASQRLPAYLQENTSTEYRGTSVDYAVIDVYPTSLRQYLIYRQSMHALPEEGKLSFDHNCHFLVMRPIASGAFYTRNVMDKHIEHCCDAMITEEILNRNRQLYI